MIDTIKLILTNVSKYPLIQTQYERATKTGNTLITIDEDTGEFFENTKIRALLHHDSNSLIPLIQRGSLHIASSLYALSYKYNVQSDSIDFEFSIPKYIYGTNILQFVNYFDQDVESQYNKLMGFVEGFANKHFIEKIDLIDLQLARIDFCYNQFFASKYDALKYLNEQKELLTKYARSTKNDYRSYETSLSYITKRYSFKIYHKGTEFKKHDKVKLANNNPTGENIDYLQEVSDKILRYEVTFRKAQIDYLFRENELYKPYLNFMFNEKSRKVFRLTNPKFYERSLKFSENGKNYVFAKLKQFEAIDTDTVYFSEDVFSVLYNFFWDYVKKYQLECKISVYDVMKKVELKNQERDQIKDPALRKKLSYNKPMIVTLALLSQYYSLDELRKTGLMAKTQFFHYQAKLKTLGFTSKNRLADIAPPSLDYLEYKYYFGKHHSK